MRAWTSLSIPGFEDSLSDEAQALLPNAQVGLASEAPSTGRTRIYFVSRHNLFVVNLDLPLSPLCLCGDYRRNAKLTDIRGER
jgi:hypothetical protein